MSLFKKASSPFLAAFLLATSLPISCTSPGATDAPQTSASSSQGLSDENQAAISGIVSIGRSQDGRFVPPTDSVLITVVSTSNDKEVARGNTDSRGRFYINGIPADSSGTRYVIKIPGSASPLREELLFAGQVKDLSNVSLLSATANPEDLTPVTVSGTLVDPDGNPRANVTVRDKEFNYLSTQTDASGQFSLEAISEELEVIISDSIPPLSFNSKDLLNNRVLTVDSSNIRTVRGNIKDITNINIPLAGVSVRVSGRSTSTLTDKDGNYLLNGVPLGPVSLEVTPPNTGYSSQSVQIPPATFTSGKAEDVVRNISLRPVGTLQVNFTSESAKSVGCFEGYNCRRYDIIPPFSVDAADGTTSVDRSEPYYDNSLGILNELTATIRIEGTDLSQTVTYPPAPLITLRGTDKLGQLVTIADAVTAPNQIVTVSFDNVPGGAQNVTISMTGHQTQKSIPVFVPAKDTISTELITLYGVQPVSALGDVKGIIRGISVNSQDVRIAYLDISEDLSISPSSGDKINPDLLERIQESLTTANANVRVNKSNKGDYYEYYLKNVPTGSRIMLVAASVDEDGKLSDCYIPNASVLLNVRAGQINLAPDLTLTKRPNECN
jgi:hypothetical protein